MMSDTEEEDNLGKCVKISLVGDPLTGKVSNNICNMLKLLLNM